MNEIPSSPFIGLVPYSEAQAPFFFGREVERDLIIDNLRASRLTVLYGTSGVGKSSVLHAGAAHRLRQIAQQSLTEYGVPEFVVVTFNAWRDDPVVGLISKIQEAIAGTLKVKSRDASPESRNLSQMMGAWSKRYGVELLVILDQFEEYFLYHPNEEGTGTFAEELPRAVNDPVLRARFLISLRDDALSKLDFFKSQIPNLFNNLLRIEHMTSIAARNAIVKPLDAYNKLYLKDRPREHYSIEGELVTEVLEQVATDGDESKPDENGNSLTNKARTIETPYLQLVMTRLWDKEREKGSHVLRLKTLTELKGIKNIVQVHLNNALESLSPEQQRIAARIFDYLVTPSGTKIAYYESDLLAKTRIAPDQLTKVLESLSASRILRPLDPPPDRPDESRHEVFHDVLAQAILDWQKQYTQTAELIEAERLKRAAATARQARVLRAMVAALLVVLAVAITFGAYAWFKNSQAMRARNEAEAARIKAEAAQSAAIDARQQAIVQSELAAQRQEDLLRQEKAGREASEQNALQLHEAKAKAEEALKKEKKARADYETVLASYDEFLKNYRSELPADKAQEFENAIASLRGVRQDDKGTTTFTVNLTPVPTTTKRWRTGQILHVRFMDGDKALQDKVAGIAAEWTKYANIKFVFDASPNAELRVSFSEAGSSWSYVGTDALVVPQTEPTIGLGILKDKISESSFRRSVLHEFGHVFGLVHEHQNPNANIPWNKIAVYRYFGGPPMNWSTESIDMLVFNKYSGAYREFDGKSVMMFLIPREFLNGNTFAPITDLGTELSESDAAFVARLYPKLEN